MDFRTTSYDVSWLNKQYQDGSLTIRPPFQRRPVWASRQKSYLIESILMNLPVPEVYLQKTTTPAGETTYAVVDGQQRIRTVLQFIGAEKDPEEAEENGFALDKLEADSPFFGTRFDALDDEQKKGFFGYSFAIRILNTELDSDIRDMFKRLNKFLTPLQPQELRNATYKGPFLKAAMRLADEPYWGRHGIFGAAQIRRMKDVEIVSELMIALMHGPQGGSAEIVDDYYEQYEDYDEPFPTQRKTEKLFKKVLETLEDVLPEIDDTRWSNAADFYSLFAAIAPFVSDESAKSSKYGELREVLTEFGEETDARLKDKEYKTSAEVVQYVLNVEKGSNEKARRANRHEALTTVLKAVLDGKPPPPRKKK